MLRSAVDRLSRRLQDTVREYDDQIDRYARRLKLLVLRDATLADLRRWRAEFAAAAEPDDPLSRRSAPPRSLPRLGRGERRALEERVVASCLFDPVWYGGQNPDRDGRPALAHYLDRGLWEDRAPHPLFSPVWWRRHAGLPPGDGRPALIAFLDSGGGQPHPLFDADFYLASNPDVRGSGANALGHYVRHGAAERRRPHVAFDPEWYGARRPGPASGQLTDYLLRPDAFATDPHPLFRGAHYLREAPGLRERGTNPLVHFLVQGWRQALTPHPLFETAYYLARNQDVVAAQVNPFLHFLTEGGRERRQAHPLFDTWWYLEGNPDVAVAGVNPLVHYVVEGADEGRSPGPAFPGTAFREAFPDAVGNPLEIFLSGEGLRLDVPRRTAKEVLAAAARRPEGDGRYWLPERLGQHVGERHGPAVLQRVYDLMRIVDAYGEEPERFEISDEFGQLCAAVREASGEPDSGPPDASIIVPVHNALVYTLTSLASVLAHGAARSFEIIVADDASTDLTPVVASLGGRIRSVRQDPNVGFLANCNAAAAEAAGRILVFLNNDTIVLPGWLDELVATFDRYPDAGLAGSKLLNGDGTLQEAGGILWRDGSAWNFGRGQDPWLPQFNYVKDVDYCSGASIAVPRAVWDELGGFDPVFKPAYCEDSDLAFRVRRSGRRTLYQPFSELVHHEGRSHGRDLASGIKTYQVRNQQTLFARWLPTLARENFDNGQNVVAARDRSGGKPHIVIVDHYVPQWDRDAGSRTMYHFILTFLARGFQVTLWPENLYRDPVYTEPLQRLGVEVIYGREFVDQFESWLALRRDWTDYVLLSRPDVAAKLLEGVKRASRAKLLYYGHDLHFRRLLDQHAVTANPDDLREAERLRREELRIAAASDLVLYPSETERDALRELVGEAAAIEAVPAWVFGETELAEAEARLPDLLGRNRFRLLFVGGFNHSPNVDGLAWFAGEVLPRLLEAEPRVHLTVVGSNPSPKILALAGPGLAIAGQVSDAELDTLYAEAAVAVVPLRFGGGVKGKVIEAFAKGVPVVSTRVGMQGIPGPDELAFVADEPDGFAQAVLLATGDRGEALARSARALAFVREHYGADALVRVLGPTVPELLAGPVPPTGVAEER